MSINSAAWRGLTQIQRDGWESLGLQMNRTDSLGQSYSLNGFAAYCSVNNNRLAAGDAVLSDAPLIVTPTPPATVTITLTAASLSVAYTPTPLGTGIRLFMYASPIRNAGRAYESDLRLVAVSAAAAASPFVGFTAYQARYGSPVTGARVFFAFGTYNGGFLSGLLRTSQVVA